MATSSRTSPLSRLFFGPLAQGFSHESQQHVRSAFVLVCRYTEASPQRRAVPRQARGRRFRPSPRA
eukprot:10969313-Alexandrium_andersonii.AAC.1